MHAVFSIEATLEAMSQLVPQLEQLLVAHAAAELKDTLLAVQELGVNIIMHGYAGQNGTIEVQLTLTEEQLIWEFRDTAPLYQPPDTITVPDPLDLPESGWGVFLIHQLMDTVEHHPLPHGNHWRLVKQRRTA